jgi:phosphoglycerate kinase
MFRKLKDCVVTNKNVFVRADLNVPISKGKVDDDTRIETTIPTLKYLLDNDAKVILTSHLGRPKGKVVPELSLKVLLPKLREFLPNTKIYFVDDCIGEKVQEAVKNTKYGEIILLENLRFHAEEAENNEAFSRELASLANLYVNDAFSCSHRKHASIVGVPKILKGCAGFCVEKEIENLTKLVSNSKPPKMVIIGGSKVSSKLELLNELAVTMDYFVIGGGMANTFLYAQDYNVGKSLYEPDLKNDALKILKQAKKNNCEIILPEDVVVCKELKDNAKSRIIKISEVEDDDIITDIGPKTIQNAIAKISECKSVVWNGPLGIYEIPKFNEGTKKIAEVIAKLTKDGKISSIAGGGDIVSSLKSIKLADKFSYISTAGGAFLQWLEGRGLPGLDVIEGR